MGGRPSPDLLGVRFERLVVVERVLREDRRPYTVWRVRCDCGASRLVPSNRLTTGNQKSCGCLRAEKMREHHAKWRIRVVDGKKKCTKCKRHKSVHLFHRAKNVQVGLASWCASCKRAARIRHYYGMLPRAFRKLLMKRGGRCWSCDDKTKLHIDHDHATGAVRGLLCGHCNRALGLLRDNPTRILALVSYLQHNGKEVKTMTEATAKKTTAKKAAAKKPAAKKTTPKAGVKKAAAKKAPAKKPAAKKAAAKK